MIYLYAVLVGVLGAILRRFYGGFKSEVPVVSERGVQTFVMICLFAVIFIQDYTSWKSIGIGLLISVWLQVQFWSRGHGVYFDLGRKDNSHEIERYDERWYSKLLNLFMSDHKYGFLYDYLMMTLRYGAPMIPMMFLDWHYILIGLSIAPIYAFCWTLQERESWIFKTELVGGATNLAELMAGFVCFGGCYLIVNGGLNG